MSKFNLEEAQKWLSAGGYAESGDWSNHLEGAVEYILELEAKLKKIADISQCLAETADKSPNSKTADGIAAAASVVSTIVRSEDIPWVDLPMLPTPGVICSVCRREQRESSSGLICENGHGGADSLIYL